MRSILIIVGAVMSSMLSAAMCVGGIGTSGCDVESTSSESVRDDTKPGPAVGTLAKTRPRDPEPVAAAPLPGDAEAKKIFEQRCVLCHGAKGLGDGQAAAGLNPKPRNYTDQAWQASVTDEHLDKVILEGGPAVGLSAAMPPNADLADKPEVIAGLRRIVRSFGVK
jgi:mono/diheme cytochrome c family protein